MSISTCVIRCDQCGDAGGVDLSSYLCTKCRVEKRRQEDVIYGHGPTQPNPPEEKRDKSISDIFNSIFRRK